MEKKNFGILLVLLMLASGLAAISTYSQVGSDLSTGTFNNTLYNSSQQFVQLNWTDATNTSYVANGTYISPVMDAGAAVRWITFLWSTKPKTCPANMSFIDKLNGYCIDQYEASMPSANSSVMGNSTEIASPNSATGKNATSRPGVVPWVSVSANTARTACTNAGKFLCTSAMWLGAADIQGAYYNLPANLSVSPYYCVTSASTYCSGHSYSAGSACNTGNKTGCRSKYMVYDMVGNVAEWTNETVTTVAPTPGTQGWYYPNNLGGWQTTTGTATAKYGDDGVYFLAGTQTGYAVVRGGVWVNGAVAGPFSADLRHLPTGTYDFFGFRCCSVPS